MVFSSYMFIFLFLPLTMAAYLWAGRRGRGPAVAVLAVASLFFYGYWKIAYVPLILGSVVFNYFMGSQNLRLVQAGAGVTQRKIVLGLGVGGNVALLGYFKYANFFVDAVNNVVGTDWVLATIVLPLGISFYTFQQIGYIVDAYRGKVSHSSFLDYFLFLTFFPQLIAGPIIKHSDTLPQFKNEPFFRFSHENLALGLTMFVFGFFKKVVIADFLATYANPVFNLAKDGHELFFFEAWGGSLAYTFQLYFDFSGYSDMAIGLGRMFGIRIPMNFNRPFRATSIIDWWRTWHMTLNSFLRENLYIPLGGNRKGWWRRTSNAMLTMFIGGIWHGAGWNFFLFAGLHSTYIFITLVWRYLRKLWWGKGPEDSGRLWQWTARFLTVIAFSVGTMLFRAVNLETVFTMAPAMAGINGLFPHDLSIEDLALLRIANRHVFEMSGFLWIPILLAFCWFWPNGHQIMRQYRPGLLEPIEEPTGPLARVQWRPNLLWTLIVIVMAALAVLQTNSESEFLYFQF